MYASVQAFIASSCIGVVVLGRGTGSRGMAILPSFQTNKVRSWLKTIINDHPPSEYVVQVLRPERGWGACMRLAFYGRPGHVKSEGVRRGCLQ